MHTIKIKKALYYSFSLSDQIEIKKLSIKYVTGIIDNNFFSAYIRDDTLFPILGLSDRSLIEYVQDKINKLFIDNIKVIKDNDINNLNKHQDQIINQIYSENFR